ncbi:MAG: GNAT family N-acetyltransferase [Synechococcus sp. SB0666_bin_14]|nr:GNAT family N-acetyltransferase [Synechococcus sp. SB0666_bin_14]MYA91364.1 GNAT family N-acetyltransferase [Synechococcus sp. SB0663_bin_10]MYG46955.1 GNAT family N-acetyltransferase [Synechococcus sp. SB0675_bin_6]MYJ59579.1 GNAT family N-acetyltransferase [Synechococcus sp. SB0672_bin_6]MYK91854.1 GNAT family N-acetyltransferase [Synechococcus sp. SB0669_bin_8]
MTTAPASLKDLDAVATLFDDYRVFYGQPSDLPKARIFMEARLTYNDSHVILARSKSGAPTGFTQLYPSFSSVRLAPLWILNDLFVDPRFRGRGVGRNLMRHAEEDARAAGACAVTLATQMQNVQAKHLYEGLGYVRDEEFDHYERSLA